ncbi:hypothetical protein BGZ65_010850, partial [Modicella reniformis]
PARRSVKDNEPVPSLDNDCEREREEDPVDFDFDREERFFLGGDRCEEEADEVCDVNVDDDVVDEKE